MKKHVKNTHKRGFSLIELLVVIAIIGFLASVALASLGEARTRSEIAKVLVDYRSIANALELYRQSNNDTYPGVVGPPAVSVQSLIDNDGPLSQYVKQAPSVSPAVVETGSIDYYLNPEDPNSKYWCGDISVDQDYILMFAPTAKATESGLFLPVYDSTSINPLAALVCIPSNQN